MKKYLVAIALMIACQNTFAQSTKDIFEEFGKEWNAESVTISPFLMTIGRLFMDNDTPDIVKSIRSMKVLDLEDCSNKVKTRFNEKVNSLQLEGYETMIQTIENGEKVRILTRMENDAIRELLIVCIGDDDCSLIQLNGKIKKEDIAELVNEETKKRKNGR